MSKKNKSKNKNKNPDSNLNLNNNQNIKEFKQNETIETAEETEKSTPEKKVKPARNLANLKTESEKDTKLFLILAFFVPFLIMGVMFIRAKVYPFGDRQVMFSDCKQQYLPFLKEYQRKLQSGESMLYSWGNGMGTNFLAMIGYYIASPLNLLTLIVPMKYIREAMAVLMMIKIGCASLFTAIFLKHVYKRNDLSLVAFGCCYAFCDFITGYYWNIIWLDSVALLPLVALGMYCIIYENKYKTYVISLALAFASSYYIGYMVCLFVVLWFVVMSVTTIKDKFDIGKFCEDLLKVAMYSAIAIAMTLPLTLPSLIQLNYTVGTDDSFPEKIEFYNNFAEIAANLMSFHEPTTMEGLPNVGTGVICVLLLAVFIRAKDIHRREKIAYISLLVFLFVSLNVNALDYIWHGFHYPNLIPSRFAFLFSFVLVAIAYRAFTVFVELDKKDIIGMCISASVMICISVFYLDKKAIIGSLIVAGLYIVFMTLYEMDLLDRRLLTAFVSLVVIAEMCLQCSIGVDTVGTTSHIGYPDKEEQVEELIKLAKEENPVEFYRTEQTDFSTKNDGMIYGYNGIGQFSSTSYKSLINFTSDFGIVSKRSSYQYLLTTPVISMLLNVKYVIDRDDYVAEDKYLELYKTSADGSVKMYENKYYLPIAYMSENRINDTSLDGDSVFVTQNKVLKALSGVEYDVYAILDPEEFNCTNMSYTQVGGGIYSYSLFDGADSGEISVTYKAPKDGMLYAWANVKSSSSVNVISENLNHTYDVESQRYIFPIGYYKEGETVEINVGATSDNTNKIAVAYLNEDIMDRIYENLSDEGLNVTKYTSTKIEGTLDAEKSGTLMTSIPYEKGWKVYVDGKKADTKEVMGAFLAAEVGEGSHNIKFVYTPEGFVVGCVLAAAAFFVFVTLWILECRKVAPTTSGGKTKKQTVLK